MRISSAAILIIICISLTSGVVSWFIMSKKSRIGNYLTAKVIRGNIENTVTAVGVLQPFYYVDVGAQVTGQLKTLKVKAGDSVKKGQLLAEIDPIIFQAKVLEASATLENLKAQLKVKEAQFLFARQQHARNSDLIKEDAVAAKDFETTEASLKTSQAEIEAINAQIKQSEAALKLAEANLGYTKITAPMSGVVVSVIAREGQTLNANQQTPVILRIADMNTMTVWAQVSEADVSRLKPGQEVYFTTLGQPDRRWVGTLRQILPTPEVINNVILYNAVFDVPNPDGDLKVQMTMQVFFVLEKAQNTLIIPAQALQLPKKKAQNMVWVLKPDGTVESRDVTVGVMNAVSVEILSGLQEGETVITGTVQLQRDGKKGGGLGGKKGGKL